MIRNIERAKAMAKDMYEYRESVRKREQRERERQK